MKYIKSINEQLKIPKQMGVGSVILIKGRPMSEGRHLYVSTITGHAEIKPGLKMVFIDYKVYRVKYKDDGNWYGQPIDYRGEEGLKGVFNMRNEGKPSLVLNNNKTPFHWITLKYTDIGKALRTLGSKLFSHEFILK